MRKDTNIALSFASATNTNLVSAAEKPIDSLWYEQYIKPRFYSPSVMLRPSFIIVNDFSNNGGLVLKSRFADFFYIARHICLSTSCHSLTKNQMSSKDLIIEWEIFRTFSFLFWPRGHRRDLIVSAFTPYLDHAFTILPPTPKRGSVTRFLFSVLLC